MTRWMVLVAFETAVLVVLVVLHVARSAPSDDAEVRSEGAIPAGIDASGRVPEPDARTDSGTAPDDRARAAAHQEERVIGTVRFGADSAPEIPALAPDGDVGIVVHGRIATADGSELPDDGYLHFQNGSETRSARWRSGAYAVTGLSPGAWTISWRNAEQGEPLALSGKPNPVRHDIRLGKRRLSPVLLLTPEGGAFIDALGSLKSSWRRDLEVVVTPEPVTDAGSLSKRRRSPADPAIFEPLPPVSPPGAKDPAGCIGWVQRLKPGSAHVHLLYRGSVLSSRVLPEGEEPVRFVLSPGDASSRFGDVRVRVVAAESGQPLPQFWIRLDEAGYMLEHFKPSPDGAYTLPRIPAGEHRLRVSAEGREHVERSFSTTSGANDLGDIALRAAAPLSIVLTRGDGSAATGTVELQALGETPRVESTSMPRATDSHGRLRIPDLAPGSYGIAAWSPDAGFARTRVDLTAGTPLELPLTLSPATSVKLVPPAAPVRDFVLTVFASDGAPLLTRRDYRFQPLELVLPPGAYRAELIVGDAAPKSIPFVVAQAPVTVEVGP